MSLILLAQDYDYRFLSHGLCVPWITEDCVLPFRNPVLSIGIFFLTLACFVATLLALAIVSPKVPIVVRSLKYVPTDLMNYTLPYVVSFMSLDYQEAGKFIGFVIFLVWMFWITYRSGQIVLNPILIAFGWRLYDITYSFPGKETERSALALVSGHLGPDERHNQLAFQEILVIKPKREAAS
ncbi:MAG: hypothetical protein RIC85_06235 [Gammaproteobacteria bacterium]